LASNGYISLAGGGSTISYSYDGLTWFPSPTAEAIFGDKVNTMVYNGTIWVAGGLYAMAYSYDGINWTQSTSGSSLMAQQCWSVAWNGSLWVAGGLSSATAGSMAYSSDGINWTASTSGNAIFTGAVIAVGWNGTWIAGGYSPGVTFIGYSTDGINWTSSQTPTNYSSAKVITARRVLPYFGNPIDGPAGAIKQSQYGSGTSHVSAFTLTVTFTTPFPATPNVTATVTNGSASWVSIGSISRTGFTAYTWNTSGGVSVPLNWQAIL
jgi:hypothetical protein